MSNRKYYDTIVLLWKNRGSRDRMEKRNLTIYPTKSVFLGYVTTVNPDSYTLEGQFQKDVVIFKQKKNERNQTIYLPIDGTDRYYSIDQLVPIQERRRKHSFLMTSTELEKIKHWEKTRLNSQPKKEEKLPTSIEQPMIPVIQEELEVNKVKKLVV